MREEAFAKFTRPLESQFVYERRGRRGLLATAGAIAAAVGVIAILALVLFNVFPRSKSDPAELAVSISTPASATPADAALMMQLGAEAVFVGSGIFKSADPAVRAKAVVQATTHFKDADILAKVSEDLGDAMPGIETSKLKESELMQTRGW